jgi:uncharacterized Zn-finger protein
MSAVAGASQEPIASPAASRKASTNGTAPPDKEKEKEKRYKCQFCNRAFSRSEHRSRHERSRKSCSSKQAIARRGALCSSHRMAGLQQTIPSIDIHH